MWQLQEVVHRLVQFVLGLLQPKLEGTRDIQENLGKCWGSSRSSSSGSNNGPTSSFSTAIAWSQEIIVLFVSDKMWGRIVLMVETTPAIWIAMNVVLMGDLVKDGAARREEFCCDVATLYSTHRNLFALSLLDFSHLGSN